MMFLPALLLDPACLSMLTSNHLDWYSALSSLRWVKK